jgi:hypothetical protein
MKILGIILGCLFVIGVIALYINGRKYRFTKNEAIDLLRRVLENNAGTHEWDDFTSIPIKNDAYLDEIRKRCFKLERKEFLDSERKSMFNESGKLEIKKILAELESQSN